MCISENPDLLLAAHETARKSMQVLEVGCGTGLNLKLYQETGCEIHGIESRVKALVLKSEHG